VILCQLTDLHVRPPGRLSNTVVDTNALTARAFQAVAAMTPRPDIVVITGDLTECGLAAEYAELRELLRVLAMPVFVIPGNHDRRENLQAGLADLPHVAGGLAFLHYTVDEYPVRLVMLDTLVPGHGHGELCPERLAFLEAALAAEPQKPTIVAMHHPPFLCGIEHMDRINLREAAEFTAIIARHRQVARIICGHHHRPINAPLAHAIASIAPSVAHQVELALSPGAPANFILEPPGYQLHCWQDGQLVSHTGVFGRYDGPFPFITDPDYPGKAA